MLCCFDTNTIQTHSERKKRLLKLDRNADSSLGRSKKSKMKTRCLWLDSLLHYAT